MQHIPVLDASKLFGQRYPCALFKKVIDYQVVVLIVII